MRFTHNALVSADVQALINFYGQWCGMKLVRDRTETDGMRVVWIAAPQRRDFVFVIIETKKPENVSPVHKSLGAHYGFALASKAAVDELHAEMSAAGLEVTTTANYGGVAGYLFIVKDPEGRNVEFSFGQDVSEANWELPKA